MTTNQETEKKPPIAKDNLTYMAVERTVMGADRSQMAWVRTGLSLISFGFTIFKFLQYQSQQIAAEVKDIGLSSPRITGLIMIAMGVLCLVFGIIEYLSIVKVYRKEYSIKRPAYSLYIAAIIAVIGILLFVGIIFRINGIG
jgi:putative membrane protein